MDKIISVDVQLGCGLDDIVPKGDILDISDEGYPSVKVPQREYLQGEYKIPPLVIKEFGIEKAVDMALTNLFQDLKWRITVSLLKQYEEAKWKEQLSKHSCKREPDKFKGGKKK